MKVYGKLERIFRQLALALMGGAMLAGAGTADAAGMTVQCLSGCLGQNGSAGKADRSLNLILRDSDQEPIKLRWMTMEAPVPEGWTLRLFAGNPTHGDRLADLGPLEFEKSGSRWVAVRELEPAQLGGGTLQAVVVREHGSTRQIVDWRAFRLLTTAERDREVVGPPPGDHRSLSLWPVALRAESSHGPLPPSTGGDRAAWWSLVDAQDRLADLDLDGEFNGAPGLGIQISAPWEAGTGSEEPRQGLKDLLQGVEGHTSVLEALRWVERDPQEAKILTDAGEKGILLKHYYTVVTLFSNASVKNLSRKDLVNPKLLTQRAFAHETSAMTNSPDDPAVWASYSLREYGADREMLSLLIDQAGEGVPGMAGMLRREGDGGPTTYHAGIKIRVMPWETGSTRHYTRAGLVGVDVVAARVGHGAVKTEGSTGESSARQALDALLGRTGEHRALDLNDPPEGFQTAPVTAELLTRSGSVPLLGLDAEYAQRGEGGEVFPSSEHASPSPASGKRTETLERLRALVDGMSKQDPTEDEEKVLEALGLPAEGRIVLSALLRSGALVEQGGLLARQPLNIVPVNGYAQFVLKLTVVMLPGAEPAMVVSDEKIAPRAEEIGPVTTLDRRAGVQLPEVGASGKMTIMAIAAAIIGVVLVILVFSVPGFRQFLSGWLRLLTPRSRSGGKDGSSNGD